MGSLRTLFAIAVLVGHASGSERLFAVGGMHAVQLFYMISGFLMSYVLVERKAYANIKTFYINRCLRLYPIYFCVAFATLIAYSIANPRFFAFYRVMPRSADILMVLSNIFLFGQDWIQFFSVTNNVLVFGPYCLLSAGMLVPPAWTLEVELTFYLIAPFILKRRRYILAFLILSLIVRAGLFMRGIGTIDTWTYRFIPAELALFLLGALSHQFLLPLYRRLMTVRMINNLSVYASIFLLVVFAGFPLILPLRELYQSLILFPLFLLLLPLAFIFQNRFDFDNRIGELSYPIYIVHYVVIWAARLLFQKLHINDTDLFVFASIMLSILFAYLLNICIGRKVEEFRLRIKMGQGKMKTAGVILFDERT